MQTLVSFQRFSSFMTCAPHNLDLVGTFIKSDTTVCTHFVNMFIVNLYDLWCKMASSLISDSAHYQTVAVSAMFCSKYSRHFSPLLHLVVGYFTAGMLHVHLYDDNVVITTKRIRRYRSVRLRVFCPGTMIDTHLMDYTEHRHAAAGACTAVYFLLALSLPCHSVQIKFGPWHT